MYSQEASSASESVVTFGLGPSDRFDALRIRWPDGSVSNHTGLAVNQLHHIARPAAESR